MNRIKKYIFTSLIVLTLIILSNCAGPGTVSVGVGVGVGGPWVGGPYGGGPYGPPGGTIWVGRPIGPVYYYQEPLEDNGIELVNNISEKEKNNL
jgi:hypothetical protein